MDFDLTQDQREIQALTRDFAQAEIDPHASQWDREHHFPRELFGKLAELGLMGACVPEEYGGAGADFLSYILVLEELSRADAGVGVTVAVHTSAATLPILAFGTDEQQRRFVPDLAAGRVIGAFALTEPDSGSDAGALRTSAVADGEGWRLSGSKQWITNGSHAGTFLVFARTDAATSGTRGVSAFLVDGSDVEVTREEEKLGLNSSSTADIRFDEAFVARDRLLHEENRGFTVAMATLDGGRIGIAAQAVGIAQAAYDVARRYAGERRQFGSRIADFQAIQFKLADMATEIAAARALVGGAATDGRGDPGAWRLRLHKGVPGRAVLPRRQDHRDLRGDERDPAHRDRPRNPRRAGRPARGSHPNGRVGWARGLMRIDSTSGCGPARCGSRPPRTASRQPALTQSSANTLLGAEPPQMHSQSTSNL